MKVHLLDAGSEGLEKILIWLAERDTFMHISVLKEADSFIKKVELEKPELVFIRLGDAKIPSLFVAKLIKMMKINTKIVFMSDEISHESISGDISKYGHLLCPIEKEMFDKILL